MALRQGLLYCSGAILLFLMANSIANLPIHLLVWFASKSNKVTVLSLSMSVELAFFRIIMSEPFLYRDGANAPKRGISDLMWNMCANLSCWVAAL